MHFCRTSFCFLGTGFKAFLIAEQFWFCGSTIEGFLIGPYNV